jgi:hypothetical protein
MAPIPAVGLQGRILGPPSRFLSLEMQSANRASSSSDAIARALRSNQVFPYRLGGVKRHRERRSLAMHRHVDQRPDGRLLDTGAHQPAELGSRVNAKLAIYPGEIGLHRFWADEQC